MKKENLGTICPTVGCPKDGSTTSVFGTYPYFTCTVCHTLLGEFKEGDQENLVDYSQVKMEKDLKAQEGDKNNGFV